MAVAPRNLTPPQKVSAALLADEISNSASRVREAEQALTEARAVRDKLIRESSSLISMLKLARLTGLTRERIYRIVYSGDPVPAPIAEAPPQQAVEQQ